MREEEVICDAHFTHALSGHESRMADAAVDGLRAAHGAEFSLKSLLVAEEHVICRCHQQSEFLALQDTVRLHTNVSSSVELKTTENHEMQIHPIGAAVSAR